MNMMEKIIQEIYVSICTFNWVHLRFLKIGKKGKSKTQGL